MCCICGEILLISVSEEILPIYFVGMLQNVAMYPNERDVFYKVSLIIR